MVFATTVIKMEKTCTKPIILAQEGINLLNHFLCIHQCHILNACSIYLAIIYLFEAFTYSFSAKYAWAGLRFRINGTQLNRRDTKEERENKCIQSTSSCDPSQATEAYLVVWSLPLMVIRIGMAIRILQAKSRGPDSQKLVYNHSSDGKDNRGRRKMGQEKINVSKCS